MKHTWEELQGAANGPSKTAYDDISIGLSPGAAWGAWKLAPM